MSTYVCKADRQVTERLRELALRSVRMGAGEVHRVRLTRGPAVLLVGYLQMTVRLPLTLNDDIPGLDGDLDPLGDLEQFLGVAVVPLSACVSNYFSCCGASGDFDDGVRASCGDSVSAVHRIGFGGGGRTCTSS
jgi:hypothetical protein